MTPIDLDDALPLTVPDARAPRWRRPVVLVLLAAFVLALVTPLAQADDRDTRGSSLRLPYTFTESGCTEISYPRGGLESAVRPLVPERFTLADFPAPEGTPARVYLNVNEVTCDRGRFPGHRTQRHYTYLIVSAYVTATEGDQRDGVYVLFYATENRVQRDALRRLGWPVTSLSRRTSSVVTRTLDGTPVGGSLHVVGGGWDHDLTFVDSAGAPPPAEASTAEFYRDTPEGAETICFANQVSVSGALYAGDLRSTPFAAVAWAPPVFYGFGGSLVAGGWDATVTTGPCPSSTSPTLRTLQSPTGRTRGAEVVAETGG